VFITLDPRESSFYSGDVWAGRPGFYFLQHVFGALSVSHAVGIVRSPLEDGSHGTLSMSLSFILC
jgi:hypothetical protein